MHEWALVDLETSGLRPGQDRVLSVAVATLGPRGQQTGGYATLLNPGCDPGPTHVHGLTRERLRGAPAFEEVAGRLGGLLEGRVLVAHNAQFDYDFLAHEFARAGSWLPVSRRLCTLALNRQIGPPTPDLRLDTLGSFYGMPPVRPHDAVDDVRVLSGILRGSLTVAARLGMPLPLMTCPPRQEYKPRVPKTPCPFRNPGRLSAGGPLVQGMKIAITGDTTVSREDLIARAVAAGLNMMTVVSRHTSAVVTNEPRSQSAKLRRARSDGVPIIDEQMFLRLLADVQPGRTHQQATASTRDDKQPAAPPMPALTVGSPTSPAPAPASVPSPRAASAATAPGDAAEADDKPLAGRRVLVIGGTHPQAAQARTRIVELGGSAAVNLSARVTDVLCLPKGEDDRRIDRIVSLGLPVRDADWLAEPKLVPAPVDEAETPATVVLPRGGVVDLPVSVGSARWTVNASWGQLTACEVDVVAFAVDEDEQVSGDDDFVFYGSAETPEGTIRLVAQAPSEQAVTIEPDALPAGVRKVVVAAAIDGTATFGEVGAIEISAAPGADAAPLALATLDAATTERTLLLAELYRRGDRWRFRAVGQGYDHTLDVLARSYGVDVEE